MHRIIFLYLFSKIFVKLLNLHYTIISYFLI